MNDLEELLRTDLARAAEPIDSDLDADDLIEAGHRAQRSRTLRLGVGLAAVLVVITGLGVAVAPTLGRVGQGPVLATPVPVPVPSSSSSASTTPVLVAPGTTDQVSFDSDSLRAATNAQSVTMNATLLANGGYSVEVGLARRDKLSEQHMATNDGRSISWVQVTPKVLVGFVPHRLDWIQYLDNDEAGPFGAFSSDLSAFSVLDATAVYRIASQSSGDYAGLRGYVWRDADGRYYDGHGTTLPTDTYNGATLYLSERLHVFGMVQEGMSASAADREGRASFLNTWSSQRTAEAASAVLLPAGASQPEVYAGVNGAQVNVAALGGRMLIIVKATVPDDRVALISSVTYTDASGKKVTDKP